MVRQNILGVDLLLHQKHLGTYREHNVQLHISRLCQHLVAWGVHVSFIYQFGDVWQCEDGQQGKSIEASDGMDKDPRAVVRSAATDQAEASKRILQPAFPEVAGKQDLEPYILLNLDYRLHFQSADVI